MGDRSERTGRNVLFSIKSVDPTSDAGSRNNIASALNDIVTGDQTTSQPPTQTDASRPLQPDPKLLIAPPCSEKEPKILDLALGMRGKEFEPKNENKHSLARPRRNLDGIPTSLRH